MRILSIAHTPFRGGANISWLNTLKGLTALGVECHVVTQEKGFLTEQLDMLSIPYDLVPNYFCVYPVERKGLKNKLLFLPRLLYRLYVNRRAVGSLVEISRQVNPDIIHTNGSVIDIGYKTARKLGIPHVWHLREYTDLDFGYNMIPSKKKYFSKISDGSFSISITRDIFRHFGIKQGKGRVIYNGVVDGKRKIAEGARNNSFIFAGTVTAEKGVTDLIDAYIMYRNRGGDFNLVLLGSIEEDYKSDLLSKLKSAGFDEYVDFKGVVDNVPDYMASSKCIIVPSKNEGFGRITAEAMSFGCLVIGRDTAGTKLQFDNGKKMSGCEIGLRFSAVNELADRMNEVSSMTDDRYLEMTRVAKKVSDELYSVETNVRETYTFLKEVCTQ